METTTRDWTAFRLAALKLTAQADSLSAALKRTEQSYTQADAQVARPSGTR